MVATTKKEKNDATKPKRYGLVVSQDLWEEVERVAADRYFTAADLLREFIKLGLWVVDTEEKPDSAIIIRENGVDTRVRIFPLMKPKK